MFRHLNLPFPTRPDVSIFDDCLGYDILFINEETNFKIIYADKDYETYRGEEYDKVVKLKHDLRFEFQDEFEEWFKREYSSMGVQALFGGISVTRPHGANTIHSDSHAIGDYSRTKINFTFADYNSKLEYFKPIPERIYQYKDDTGCVSSCIDEKDCEILDVLKYESMYPTLLDTRQFHRRNNRPCKTTSVVMSYNIRDMDGKFIDFKTAETIFQDILIPKDCKINLLSDI
tara:strand:+ start:1019 stop:1711 length:693 start_codon:yes stop_codon:yes gene_type:complete